MALNGSSRRARLNLRRVFAAPLAIALLSAVGLVSALVGDHIWDVLSWLTLAAPVAIVLWYWMRQPS